MRAPATRPSCPACGERIGAYEPVWRLAPPFGAELTSWLLVRDLLAPLDSLWHQDCAEAGGIAGG